MRLQSYLIYVHTDPKQNTIPSNGKQQERNSEQQEEHVIDLRLDGCVNLPNGRLRVPLRSRSCCTGNDIHTFVGAIAFSTTSMEYNTLQGDLS